MSLLSKLQQVFRPAKAVLIPPAARPLSAAEVNELFQRELLNAIGQHFPVLQVVSTERSITLHPAKVTLETDVLELTRHPNALVGGFTVRLSQPDYLPQGITECLAGIGEDEATAAEAAARNYVEGVLSAVIEAFEGRHDVTLDITSPYDAAIWHPVLGLLQVQGAWVSRSQELTAEYFFELFKPLLLEHLQPQPFHWLKLYASRQPTGKFIGECQLDNQSWEAGLNLLRDETNTWPDQGKFAAQRQFLLLRRCGLCQPARG